jgi:hypothetical protein
MDFSEFMHNAMSWDQPWEKAFLLGWALSPFFILVTMAISNFQFLILQRKKYIKYFLLLFERVLRRFFDMNTMEKKKKNAFCCDIICGSPLFLAIFNSKDICGVGKFRK